MIKGSCLCNKIEIVLQVAPKTFGVCHCIDCRKWTGGVFMSVHGGKDLIFSNEKLIGKYSSSAWAQRGFCKNCGTNIYYKMKKSNYYFLMLGLFGDSITPIFEEQQFIDEKPKNYCFSNETKNITKAQMNQMLKDFLAK